MVRRAFELILLLATLVGGVLAWSSGQELSRLSKEFDRLARTTGNLAIGDPDKVHLMALDTGDPMHFAWRVYFPANYPVVLAQGNGNQSSSSSSVPTEAILRVRFRQSDKGYLDVYTKALHGSSRLSIGDKALADLLRGRWGEIKVEQAGAKEVFVIGQDEKVSLIKLTLPDAMQEEAKRKLSASILKNRIPVLYDLKLGTAKP